MLGSLVASGTGIFAFALIAGFANLLPNAFHAGLICVALTNLFISIFMVTSMTALQLRCPDSLRGRVMGLHGVAFNLMILGSLFTGALASLLGAPASLAIAALIVTLAATAALATQPEVRRLDGRAVPGPNPE
jgi:MFS family permease